MRSRRWHAEISFAALRGELKPGSAIKVPEHDAHAGTPQGAAKVKPAARVGPKAVPVRTLLFMYQIAVWRVLGLNSR